MIGGHYKNIFYGLLFLGGIACLALAFHQYQYTQLVVAGNQAIIEKRFDSQEYTLASHFRLASQDRLLFNQGILAYKARNFPRAAEHLHRASQLTHNPVLRMKTFYNLGMIMLALEEAEGAAEMFKEALRTDPSDKEAKFNLERLYQMALRKKGDQGKTALEQAPGSKKDKGKDPREEGTGRSTLQADI